MTMPDQNILSFATILTPAQMNTIHFGGNHTPITPEQIEEIARRKQENMTTVKSPGDPHIQLTHN